MNRSLAISMVILMKMALVLLLLPLFGEIVPGFYQVEGFYDRYDYIAKNILDGNGYRVYPETSETMLRLPGFVYLLTFLFWVFGDSLLAFKAVNLICSLLSAFFIFHIARRHLRMAHAAWVAPLVFLFYPAIILAESRGGVEIVYTLCVTGFLYFLLEAFSGDRYTDYFWSGIFLGISVIVKSTTLVVPAFLLVFMIVSKRGKLNFLAISARVLILTLPMILLLTPWAIRNYQLVGEVVVTQSNLGTTAYQGMYVNRHWTSSKPHYLLIREATKELSKKAEDLKMPFRYDFFQHFYSAKDEYDFNRFVTDQVLDQYTNSPMLLVKNCFLNFFRFWFQGRSWSATLLNTFLVLPFLAISLFGFLRSDWKNEQAVFLVYFSAVFVASHLPILTTARYHVPMVPILSLYAGFAITFFAHRFQGFLPISVALNQTKSGQP